VHPEGPDERDIEAHRVLQFRCAQLDKLLPGREQVALGILAVVCARHFCGAPEIRQTVCALVSSSTAWS